MDFDRGMLPRIQVLESFGNCIGTKLSRLSISGNDEW
jgi:hypothetical protein